MQDNTPSRKEPLSTNSNEDGFSFEFFNYESKINQTLDEIIKDKIIERIWAKDYTVWKPSPNEISNRLGWLNIAEDMQTYISPLFTFTEDIKANGFTQAVLLGMGGSSLAPEVLRITFGVKEGFLDLRILDSTDSDTISALTNSIDIPRALFIVATKSGGTVETLSFFKYFYNQVVNLVGQEKAGSHFIAITDPGSKLVDIAEQYKFGRVFLNDPNIGGRYSALSFFGLVPATLIGIDLERFLNRAQKTIDSYKDITTANIRHSLGIMLGVFLGEMAKAGRDKMTLVLSPEIQTFGNWVEQLIAESTGKEGTGILPIIEKRLETPSHYGKDRFFVFMNIENDHSFDHVFQAFKNASIPFFQISIQDPVDLSGQFFVWEIATAIASYCLGINPFDQPNVESAKIIAKKFIAEYNKNGELPAFKSTKLAEGLQVLSDMPFNNLPQLFSLFFSAGKTDSYICIQAYLQETIGINLVLLTLGEKIQDLTKLAVTIGYGPRFLHSTGQLHKGDSGNGLFIQLISPTQNDINIPDEAGSRESSISFGILKLAQAIGDRQALLDAGRKVITFIIEGDITHTIKHIVRSLEEPNA